ncbi:MAG: fatty acid desaturase [Phycisphaeraceae bacterium]
MPDLIATKSAPESAASKRSFNWRNLDWTVVIAIAAIHVGALAAPFYFTWSGLAVAIFFMWLTGGIGITLCYHRLLTHRSFKTPKWFEYILTTIGTLAWQGGPVQWVGNHRLHHAHSDEELDPHSPQHGFTWAHMWWCMHKQPEGRSGADAARDLSRDPVTRLLNDYFFVPQFLLVILTYFAGEWAARMGLAASGISWVVWGVCVRTVVVYHGTWFVNSAAHTWGYRNFKTKDLSTNLWWVALLSFGEGWHNNHHAYQRSAAHGLRWFEFDLTYWTIRLLGLVGLAKDIVYPTDADVKIVDGKSTTAPGATTAQPRRAAADLVADTMVAASKPTV